MYINLTENMKKINIDLMFEEKDDSRGKLNTKVVYIFEVEYCSKGP